MYFFSTLLLIDKNFAIVLFAGVEQRQIQVLNVMADYLGNYVAIAHCIMTSKCTDLYYGIMKVFKDQFPEWNPSFVMSDFESSLRNGIQAVVPDAKMLGCSFHFAKAIFAKICKVGLKPYYHPGPHSKDLNSLSMKLRQLMAIPLLSPSDIRFELPRLEVELAKSPVPEKVKRMLKQVFDYVISTWIIRFGVENLSVYKSNHTTNNCVERLHNTMNECIVEHGTVFNFLLGLNDSIIKGAVISSSQQEAGTYKTYSKMSKEKEKLRELQLACREKYEKDEIGAKTFLEMVATKFQCLNEDDLDRFYVPTSEEIHEMTDDVLHDYLDDGIMEPWDRPQGIWDGRSKIHLYLVDTYF